MQAMVTLIAITLRLVSTVAHRLAGRFAFFLFRRPIGPATVRPDERDIHDDWAAHPARYAALVRELTGGGQSATAFDARDQHWSDLSRRVN